MNELFANFRTVDEDFFEELEETLIGADVGFETAIRITEALRQEVKLRNAKKSAEVQNAIIEKLVDLYEAEGINEVNELNIQEDGLTVILFVGVNGVGKTTSIGKLAHQFKNEGKKVLMAAADTFRAGAIDQLVVWGERAGVEVVRGNAGGDPAAVVFDALERAKTEQADVLLVDTAGRLQNKVNLMNELEKNKTSNPAGITRSTPRNTSCIRCNHWSKRDGSSKTIQRNNRCDRSCFDKIRWYSKGRYRTCYP